MVLYCVIIVMIRVIVMMMTLLMIIMMILMMVSIFAPITAQLFLVFSFQHFAFLLTKMRFLKMKIVIVNYS